MPTGACENKATNPVLKHMDYFLGSVFSSVPDSCQVILVDPLPRVVFLKNVTISKCTEVP